MDLGIPVRHILSALTSALKVASFLVVFSGPQQMCMVNSRTKILSERDAEAL